LLTALALFGLVGAAAAAAVPTASGTAERGAALGKPVIGKAVTVPSTPLAGKRFLVSFKVTRSDTKAPLMRGIMACDPSIAGKVMTHSESFRAGIARLSFVVPANAAGKMMKVKLTIRAVGGSSTRVTAFRIQQAAKPAASISGVSVSEGNSGTKTMSFPVALSAASTQTVTIGYATADGTATAGTDYLAASGTLTFKPGETAKTISVTVNGDTIVEPDETFTVSLSKATSVGLGTASATGTITNDDNGPRSGHYVGTTSLGKAISFDVTADLKSLANLDTVIDLNCAEVQGFTVTDEFTLTGPFIDVAPDWSFNLSIPVSDPEFTANFAFSGKLAVPGSASGSFRFDMNLLNTPSGTVHCSTGDVTWSANAS
jgi:hypothetical protein